MMITQFENELGKTNFSPVFNYYMYEDVVDEDLKNIKLFLINKEKEIIDSHDYVSDWNTGLGKNSITSRSNSYNLLKWQECFILREIIRTSHDNFITSLGYEWEDKIYVQCWANILRKDQFIKQHQHWNSEYTYIGGHISLDDYGTKTHYVNPYNRKLYSSQNEKAKITLFPNWLEHYTELYKGEDLRVTIAFDIITEVVYEEDIYDNKKSHWVQL